MTLPCQLLLANGRVLPGEINYYGNDEFEVIVDPTTSAVEFPPDRIVGLLIDIDRTVQVPSDGMPGLRLKLIDLGQQRVSEE